MNIQILASSVFAITIIGSAFAAVFIADRQKQERKVEPPEKFVLLRGPGENLRKEVDALTEKLITRMVFGSLAALFLTVTPALLLHLLPWANVWLLLGSGAALFIAALVWTVRGSIALIHKRTNKHLGYLGERRVAEELQKLQQRGYAVFHDVPLVMGEWKENVDHIAIGPSLAAVIETKTRSKPLKVGKERIEVRYDGQFLHWPQFQNDSKPLKQVGRYAEWLERFIKNECGISLPVCKVIAIPGWSVTALKPEPVRVVSARGVADAVSGQAKQDVVAALNSDQMEKICEKLEELCRDVTV